MELKLNRGSVVFLDTSPFIYLIEEHAVLHAPVRLFLERCMSARAQLVTSFITYIELLTKPERAGRTDLAARYRLFLTNSENLTIYPLNPQVADETVRFRAKYGFKTPDAIQLATAQVCGADFVLTNDADWKRCEELRVGLVSELI